MPSYPPLSQLPGFMPAAKAGTSQHREMVRAILRDTEANEAFVRQLARLATHSNHSTSLQPSLEKGAANG